MANYVFAWNGGKPVQDELHIYIMSRIKTPRHFIYNDYDIIKETQESDKEGFAEVMKK